MSEAKHIRVNLFVTKDLHKRLRMYAIDNDDKSLVGTIQDILEDYLKAKKIPGIVFELVKHEIHRSRSALKSLSLTTGFNGNNPQDHNIHMATMKIREDAIAEYQQFLKDFGEVE